MTEQQIQQQIRLALGRGDVRLWRNNTGALRDEHGRLVRFGLGPGSADLIGLRTIEVGNARVAQFVALEVKGARGRATQEQLNFLALVESMGGVAALVRSVEEAELALRGPPGHSG
ncbi:MAG: VRR-NUC domain-containing protein [Cyanobacteriota bacterium]|nr:VRR-NUC domain-containing protein [Cyanobacteriota bacterium]